MRLLALAAVAAGWVFAAAPLAIVQPAISIMEAGMPDLPGAVHVPGETVYFSCRILNYTRNPDDKVRLAYSVQAFDPAGVPLAEAQPQQHPGGSGCQDKTGVPGSRPRLTFRRWCPREFTGSRSRSRTWWPRPAPNWTCPCACAATSIQPGAALTVQNLQLFRGENDTEPVAKPAYRPGDVVWARFDIAGFKYGPGNKVDVSYVTALVAASGTVLWKQTEPAVERSESFYPKRYIPADFGLNLDKNIRPGEYAITITVKDDIGNQTYEMRQTFTVE